MAKQRNNSTEFKRQILMECLAGETLCGLFKRHDVLRNVIRLWIARYEADGEHRIAGDLLQDYKARIAQLERLAGKLVLQKEFLKWALENACLENGTPSCVVAGSRVSRSPKDAE